ncbi:MAG: hypothetical protein RIC03_11275 [Cyclobacteriaceae bacterium]
MLPKNAKIILFFLILLTVAILESCKCYGGDYRGTLENIYTIYFRLLDRNTEQSLIGFGARYDSDSVLVYDANGVLIYPGPVPGDGMVDLRPYLRSDELIPVDKDTTEYYYLHLRDQGLDIDTLRIDYQAAINDCSEKEFTKLNLYYNEELIYDNDRPTTGYYVELYK